MDCILFSDEVQFRLSGHVNRYDFRFGAREQRHQHFEKLSSVEKKRQYGVHLEGNNILGPYFFEDDDGHMMILNAERYIECSV